METQPRKRDADRSRAEILDAAERLFAAQGFDVVTMADIGAAAGVSRGTPGYFFGQKEQLYRVVLERAAATFRMLGETLRARHTGGGRDVVLRETVEAFVGLLAARPEVVRLLDRDAGATVGAPHAEAVADALASTGEDARSLALTIVSLAWYPVAHPESAAVLGIDPASPDFAAALCGRVLAAVAALPADGRSTHSPTPPPPSPPAAPESVTPAPDPPAAAAAEEVAIPDARFVHDVVLGDKKKKKKKKKRKE